MNAPAVAIIDALGGTAEVARMFEIRMPSVSAWRHEGIPRARMLYLKAVRPDVLAGVDVDAATAIDRIGSEASPDIKTTEGA